MPDTRPAQLPMVLAPCGRHSADIVNFRSPTVLHYAVVFFVIALIAAVFGFGGIAASAVGIAKILFIVFAVLAVATFVFGLFKKS